MLKNVFQPNSEQMHRFLSLIFLVLVLSASCAKPKPYYYDIDLKSKSLLDEAKQLIKKGDLIKAISNLDSIVCLNDFGCRFRDFYYAKAYAKIDSSLSSMFLEKSISNGQLLRFIEFSDFPFQLDTIKLINIEAKYLQITQDNQTFRTLRTITKRDQAIRKSCKFNKQECKDKINYIDSINLIKLDSIVEKIGWPGFTTIGFYIPKEFFPQPDLILLHSDLQTCKSYLKLIRNSCLKNEEYWSTYKGIITNILMRYHYAKDTILIDFIPETSILQLKNNLNIPELEPLLDFLSFRSDSFKIHPLNNTSEEYAEIISKNINNADHKIAYANNISHSSNCINCFLLIKSNNDTDN